MNEYSDSFAKNVLAINKVERYAKKLPEFPRGFAGQTGARVDSAIKTYSKDPAFTQYMGVVNQEMIPLARNLAEEKGPITEFDVKRIESGLGSVTTPFEDKQLLLAELKAKTSQAIIMKMEKAGFTFDQIQTEKPNLANTIKKTVIEYAKVVPIEDLEVFDSLEELEASLLPFGSPALVQGKRAVKGF